MKMIPIVRDPVALSLFLVGNGAVFEEAGSAVKWENPETSEQETLCTGGKNGLKELLMESTIHYEHFKNLCLNKESTYLEDIKNVQQTQPSDSGVSDDG